MLKTIECRQGAYSNFTVYVTRALHMFYKLRTECENCNQDRPFALIPLRKL